MNSNPKAGFRNIMIGSAVIGLLLSFVVYISVYVKNGDPRMALAYAVLTGFFSFCASHFTLTRWYIAKGERRV